ncbi:hypothetical protein KI387_043358, partial [Taxus chinensis]
MWMWEEDGRRWSSEDSWGEGDRSAGRGGWRTTWGKELVDMRSVVRMDSVEVEEMGIGDGEKCRRKVGSRGDKGGGESQELGWE